MVLAMFKRKGAKAQSLRNQAVQAVGESYFLVAMFGLVVSGVLGILTVAMGSTHGLFRFRLDRCNCLLISSNQASVDAGKSCIFDQNHIGVDIGWKSFVIDEAVTTQGCLDGWEGTTDIGTPFGDGAYSKKSESYGNGATGAADAAVGLFVVSSFVALIMYKTVRMSYSGPGSIYSIGLHNIAGMCFLLSIASGIAITAFWGRIQGKLGSLDSCLSNTLFKAVMDVCEQEWDQVRDGDFCEAKPWSFDVPRFAGYMAITHVACFFFTSAWILSKSAFVEGILDGSRLTDGKPVLPRVVEYEQAVGRALATTEDPDYDAANELYGGQENIMIRPYPLPGTTKNASRAVPKPLNSPLRQMSGKKGGFDRTRSGSGTGSTSPRGEDEIDPALIGSLSAAMAFSPENSPRGKPDKISEPSAITKERTKAEVKASKKASKKKAKGNQKPEPSGHSRGASRASSDMSGVVNDLEDSSTPEGHHEKTRSEIDWGSIIGAKTGDKDSVDSPKSDEEELEERGIDKMPSDRDDYELGVITEDPREDLASEFASSVQVSPRKTGAATRFEV